jgi:hypothetical protein
MVVMNDTARISRSEKSSRPRTEPARLVRLTSDPALSYCMARSDRVIIAQTIVTVPRL